MRIRLLQVFFVFALLFSSQTSIAGGPFVVDMVNNTGVALRWENDTFEWWVDAGRLTNSVDNGEATQWIKEELDKWTGVQLRNAENIPVSTTTIKHTFRGTVGEDIDVTNWGNYMPMFADPGDSVIAFDEDGSIIEALVGAGNSQNIVGLTLPIADASGTHIIRGWSVFNGQILSSGILAPTPDVANELFRATVLHELGHLLNLDHSQVNFDIAQNCVRNGPCEGGNDIPTMYPELLTTLQGILARDDKITLSWIYPTQEFEQDFCTITGKIFDADGRPLKGVNVLAHRVNDGELQARVDARSFVSGVLYPGCEGDSHYYLRGIVPGKQYQVTYEPIGSQFVGASDFEPLGDDSPRGFDAGTIESPSGDTTVKCDQGGQTIQMASVTIDVSNPCVTVDGDDEDEVEAKAGCAMMSGDGLKKTGLLAAALLLLAAAALALRRHFKSCKVRGST